ncbi:MAG: HAD family hydrolase [Patescibacteria group bacterium]|jgi:HAD superfamily hydrolase (TIGR01490 family)
MAIAIFDLDGTLIRGQSQLYIIKYLYKRRLISVFDLIVITGWFLGYWLSIFNDPRIIFSFAFRIIKGKDENEVKALVDGFYEKVLRDKFRGNVVNRLVNHKNNNDEIYLLTNAIKPIARAVADDLGIRNVIATEMEVIGNKYTGKIKGDIIYGKQKVKALKKIFTAKELLDSFIYADHYSDIEMLKLADHPVLVYPDSKSLSLFKNYFREKKPEIIN